MKRTRRDFIKKGLISTAGISIIPNLIKPEIKAYEPLIRQNKIIYRTLGRTGIRVPIVGLGIYDNTSMLPHAYNKGLTYINSNGDYQNGNPERRIGEFVSSKPRDSFIVATGFDPRKYLDNKTFEPRKNAARGIIRAAEDSLKRLKLEYIDIYFSGDLSNTAIVLFESFFRAAEELKRSGKVRFIGGATHQNEPLVLRTAADSDVYDVVMTAYNFRKDNREDIKSAIAYAAGKGLGIIAMKTQAGVYWDRDRKNMINMKAALKWALHNENVHTSVPAFYNTDELDEGFSVMENLTLTPSELRDLKIIDEKSDEGLFCQQCGKCMDQCPGSPDIPALMRCYMYAYGYRNIAKAKDTLSSLNPSEILCRNCESCTVKCTMGFDIRKKVLDIIRINEIPEEFLC
ncbi:aldo/keto reductase [candidate division KSB1 bacterium]